MYDDGYHNIINIDISPTVIQNMKERNQHRAEMEWIAMNALKMEF